MGPWARPMGPWARTKRKIVETRREKEETNKIRYVEAPVMGGPVQAEQGILGAIVGSKKEDYQEAKNILLNFCKEAIYFGEVGKGAKAKLLSNFLSFSSFESKILKGLFSIFCLLSEDN